MRPHRWALAAAATAATLAGSGAARTVLTVAELQAAAADGVAHIVIADHLNVTEHLEGGGDGVLDITASTLTIRVLAPP